MKNHVNPLTDGLELTVLGTYLAALDHGKVRDMDFTAYAGDVARYASLARWVIATTELVIQWPTILDWHAGCLSSLGLIRGLTRRAWVYASHWDVLMHYELASGPDWEERVPSWLCIASALGHDISDLCIDTRMGCVDNAYLVVGTTTEYEGVAACMNIVCDALEAVVLHDTRGAIDIGAVACTAFERTGGALCVCSKLRRARARPIPCWPRSAVVRGSPPTTPQASSAFGAALDRAPRSCLESSSETRYISATWIVKRSMRKL
ncbi:hypothetical protein V8C35DRAFT_286306 [Trichoderma chlorosporum]